MKWAETWLDVGRLPLRRRDVNAMRLALDGCRGLMETDRGYKLAITAMREGDARHALMRGGPVSYDIVDAYDGDEHSVGRTRRLKVTRLALLLRVLLRADEGDFGALECDCEEPVPLNYVGYSQAWCNGCRCWTDMIAPVRPLWEAAR